MEQGDVIALKCFDGLYRVYKILQTEAETDTLHCLIYQPSTSPPRLEEVNTLAVAIYHVPIGPAELKTRGQWLGRLTIGDAELIGYHEYLRQTDWRRYASETKLDLNAVLNRALEHYQTGCMLADNKRYESAISAFSDALDCFPLLTEALDNRGLTYMDLGRFQEAITDFEESWRQNPESPLALFSLGECYLKLKEYDSAVTIFSQCVARWPEREENHRFLQMARAGGRTWRR